jgi:hypothetical protein
VARGSIAEVSAEYRNAERTIIEVGRFNPHGRFGSGWAQIADLALVDDAGRRITGCSADNDLIFEVEVELRDAERSVTTLRGLVVELVICSDQGLPLLSLMNADDGGIDLPSARRCRVQARLEAPTFVPGRYRVNAFIGIPLLDHVDEISDALEFEILPPASPWRPFELHIGSGIVCRRATWSCDAAVHV